MHKAAAPIAYKPVTTRFDLGAKTYAATPHIPISAPFAEAGITILRLPTLLLKSNVVPPSLYATSPSFLNPSLVYPAGVTPEGPIPLLKP